MQDQMVKVSISRAAHWAHWTHLKRYFHLEHSHGSADGAGLFLALCRCSTRLGCGSWIEYADVNPMVEPLQ
jgi:hypothetical protein